MICSYYQELISRMLDEDLSPVEQGVLEAHLPNCEACAAMYKSFSALSQALEDQLEEPPESLRYNVMAEIRRAEIRKKNRLSRPMKIILSTAACLALIVGISMGSGVLRAVGDSTRPLYFLIFTSLLNITLDLFFVIVLKTGIAGAAIATVMARFVECGIVMSWAHRNVRFCPYMEGAFRSLRVPGDLFRQVMILGAPLLINEFLWSSGMTVLNQCYSLRGLEFISAFNISNTI